jgi:hypothetical protein
MNQYASNSSMNNNNMINPTAGMSVYMPSSEGTLISDLYPTNSNNMNQNPNQYMPNGGMGNMNNMNGNKNYVYNQPRITEVKHIPNLNPYSSMYIDSNHSELNNGNNNNEDITDITMTGQNNSQHSNIDDNSGFDSRNGLSNYNSIKSLAEDVNKSLIALEKDSKKNKKKGKNNIDTKEIIKDHNDENNVIVQTFEKKINYALMIIEFVLLLSIYVIMSQPFIVNIFSRFIKQLNPDENGDIRQSGIIIYGFILTVLFFGLKNLILSRM